MPIKVSCQCGQKFTAKDQLAGKAVKCPKCGQPLRIPSPAGPPKSKPQAQSLQAPSPSQGGALSTSTGGLGSLLDEAGLGTAPVTGPKCPACGVAVATGAVICVECGFNSQTGQQMQTFVHQDPEAHLSDAEKHVAKMERERLANPDVNEGGFGDEGIGAYLVTFGMMFLAVVGVVVISAMGIFMDYFMSPMILLSIGSFLMLLGMVRMYILAFKENPLQVVYMLMIPLYFFYFGITRFETTKIPLMVFITGAGAFIAGVFMGRADDNQPIGGVFEAIKIILC